MPTFAHPLPTLGPTTSPLRSRAGGRSPRTCVRRAVVEHGQSPSWGGPPRVRLRAQGGRGRTTTPLQRLRQHGEGTPRRSSRSSTGSRTRPLALGRRAQDALLVKARAQFAGTPPNIITALTPYDPASPSRSATTTAAERYPSGRVSLHGLRQARRGAVEQRDDFDNLFVAARLAAIRATVEQMKPAHSSPPATTTDPSIGFSPTTPTAPHQQHGAMDPIVNTYSPNQQVTAAQLNSIQSNAVGLRIASQNNDDAATVIGAQWFDWQGLGSVALRTLIQIDDIVDWRDCKVLVTGARARRRRTPAPWRQRLPLQRRRSGITQGTITGYLGVGAFASGGVNPPSAITRPCLLRRRATRSSSSPTWALRAPGRRATCASTTTRRARSTTPRFRCASARSTSADLPSRPRGAALTHHGMTHHARRARVPRPRHPDGEGHHHRRDRDADLQLRDPHQLRGRILVTIVGRKSDGSTSALYTKLAGFYRATSAAAQAGSTETIGTDYEATVVGRGRGR